MAAGAPPFSSNGNRPVNGLRTFTVGVTGHRLERLADADLPALQRRIHDCLQVVRDVATGSSVRYNGVHLVVASPVAEGADRLVAEEAIALGFALYAPLPFQRDEYERDFTTPESRAAYRNLLTRAETVHEFAGTRAAAGAAYAAAGLEVLNSSDMLIAVWDGREARGDGGTGQMVLEAIHRHLLTVWIRASAPHEASLIQEEARRGWRPERIGLLRMRVAERTRRLAVPGR